MDSEENGFFVFMHMLLDKELKPLFLPVSILDVTCRECLSCTWRTSRWRSWSSFTCQSSSIISARFKCQRTTSPPSGSWLCSLASYRIACCHPFSTLFWWRGGRRFSGLELLCCGSWRPNWWLWTWPRCACISEIVCAKKCAATPSWCWNAPSECV